ncbi:Uu.00g128590.m01.CDS01 [Anthostomella pinea]|uniref:Uu.00g128590.m01.CDS01 n=1 Tax=Anthostomella pinea TaxID=933095 RepID=A0AAI8VIC6_9PEZI|nr:Uu.00g128590.m01.CDS01 [Anthostomella pinea]
MPSTDGIGFRHLDNEGQNLSAPGANNDHWTGISTHHHSLPVSPSPSNHNLSSYRPSQAQLALPYEQLQLRQDTWSNAPGFLGISTFNGLHPLDSCDVASKGDDGPSENTRDDSVVSKLNPQSLGHPLRQSQEHSGVGEGSSQNPMSTHRKRLLQYFNLKENIMITTTANGKKGAQATIDTIVRSDFLYEFTTREEAKRLGLPIRPWPVKRRKQYLTPVGRVIPFGYVEASIEAILNGIPPTTTVIMVLDDVGGLRNTLIIGRHFLEKAAKAAAKNDRRRPNQGIQGKGIEGTANLTTRLPQLSDGVLPISAGYLPRLNSSMFESQPYLGVGNATNTNYNPFLLAPPVPGYPTTSGAQTPFTLSSSGDFSALKRSSATSQSALELPVCPSGFEGSNLWPSSSAHGSVVPSPTMPFNENTMPPSHTWLGMNDRGGNQS